MRRRRRPRSPHRPRPRWRPRRRRPPTRRRPAPWSHRPTRSSRRPLPETSAAPAPAVFTQPIDHLALTVGEDTGGVSLAWTPSDAADFGRYVIARGTAADHQLDDIAELGDRQITSFTDPAAPHGVVLMYQVVAMSEDGRPLAASDVVELTLQDGSASSAPTHGCPADHRRHGCRAHRPPDDRAGLDVGAGHDRSGHDVTHHERAGHDGRGDVDHHGLRSHDECPGDDLRPAERARDDEQPRADDDERPLDAARHRARVQRAADGHHPTRRLTTDPRSARPPDQHTAGRRASGCDPVLLRVVLDELLDHVAVDGVDEDEATPPGRLLGRVAEDAPRRAAAQAPPRQLRRGVPDGEADRVASPRPAPAARRPSSANPTVIEKMPTAPSRIDAPQEALVDQDRVVLAPDQVGDEAAERR